MATYYVDATLGLDGNTGLSELQAWQTFANVNAGAFLPGDQIRPKRGGIWRETVTPPSSGTTGNHIRFRPYGTGAKPVITGADLVTTWGDEGGGAVVVGYPRFEEPWSSEQSKDSKKRSANLDRLLGVKRD